MRIKKIIFSLLVFGLVMSSIGISPVGASDFKDKVTYMSEDNAVQFTVIEDTETYSKVKVEYLDTGEVEYMESVMESGNLVHYVLSEEGEKINKIESKNDDVYIDGEKMTDNTITVEPNYEPSVSLQSNEFSAMAIKWKYQKTTKGNNSWKVAKATLIVTYIAALLKLPIGSSLVLSTATTFASLELTQIWYKQDHYIDSKANYNTCKRAKNTYFYKVSNYTGLVKSTGKIVESIDPCNSGY